MFIKVLRNKREQQAEEIAVRDQKDVVIYHLQPIRSNCLTENVQLHDLPRLWITCSQSRKADWRGSRQSDPPEPR